MTWTYRDKPFHGQWGEITSRENYCEEDYVVTPYIAEVVNTLTNLTYLIYSYQGVRRSKSAWESFPYLGLACVGIGSAAFHGTVKLQAQWSDDLSMLLATGIMVHRLMSYGKTPQWSRLFGLGLSIYLVGVSFIHCYFVEQRLFQSTFVGMLILAVRKMSKVANERYKDPEIKGRLVRFGRTGTVFAILGYACWVLDNLACERLRGIRRSLGLPWGFLLEFHGWWHILTGIATYIYMVLVETATADSSVEASLNKGASHAWPVPQLMSGASAIPLEKQI